VGSTPAGLATVNAVLRDPFPAGPFRPLAKLLQAFLEHRFGADVGIGQSALAAADHDIGIAR
jgi:hypothetical protein